MVNILKPGRMLEILHKKIKPENLAKMASPKIHLQQHLSPQNDDCRPCDQLRKNEYEWSEFKVTRGQGME